MAEFSDLSKLLGNKFELTACLKKTETTGVYIALDSKSRKVILKVLFNKLVDSEALNRFKREARILTKLNHKNIVKILEWNFEHEISFITYEYFESENLRIFLQRKTISEERKIKLITELLEGIDYLHKNNVIHRDLKPDNILVNKNFELKITDFGLSFLHNDEFTTQNYSILGTPSYMSPEQIQGKRITNQSDLFSAGVIIYEIFTGNNPFIDKDFNQTLNNILNFNVEKLKTEREKFPPSIYTALTLLLEKNPVNRAKSAEEIISLISKTYKPIEVKQSKSIYRKVTLPIFLLILVIAYFVFNEFAQESGNVTIKKQPLSAVAIDSTKSKAKIKNKPTKKNSPLVNTLTNPATNINKPQKEIPKTTIKRKISNEKPRRKVVKTKKINFNSFPWAEITIDSKKLGITPLEKPIELSYGKHFIIIKNPFYPIIKKEITINANSPDTINYNLAHELSVLVCKIFPWGDLYVDSLFIGESPFTSPHFVIPGEHLILIKNPNFPDYKQKMFFKGNDTVKIIVNFTEINSNN